LNRYSADFLDQLIQKLPSTLAHFKHRASHYVPHSSGVTLHFTDTSLTPFEADLIICSDGIKSSLRACMYERKGLDLRKQKAVYSEWIAWRGLIKRSQFEDAFGKDASDKMMHCGEGRHILVSSSTPFPRRVIHEIERLRFSLVLTAALPGEEWRTRQHCELFSLQSSRRGWRTKLTSNSMSFTRLGRLRSRYRARKTRRAYWTLE
jgi:2-polyprenyl-6-methoxyphenol hydroxylase-like FAD-dependent oxidoreductase